MALPDTITIKFKPEGDRQLTNAIKSLDRATKSLLNSQAKFCLLYTSPSPRDGLLSRMPSSA